MIESLRLPSYAPNRGIPESDIAAFIALLRAAASRVVRVYLPGLETFGGLGLSPLPRLRAKEEDRPHRDLRKEYALFTIDEAAAALASAGIDITGERFELDDVRAGMDVELEHGTRFPDLDVTGNDPVVTAKIALAHLREFPDYYERLGAMEREADAAWAVETESDQGVV